MPEGKIRPTDGQISTAVSAVAYFDDKQRQLMRAAIAIHSSKHGGLENDSVKELLRDLENAGLITGGGADSLMKKLFNE